MPYLLLPDDEVRLMEHLIDDEGLPMLLADRFPDGPHPPISEIGDVRRLLPARLPPPARPRQRSEEPRSFVFWVSQVGPLRRAGEAPPPVSAQDRVARKVLADAAVDAHDVMDYELSPILRFQRCRWHDNGALLPGLLQGPALRRADWHPDVRRLHSRIERWLRRDGARIDAFNYASAGVEPPLSDAARRRFAVWAFPQAVEWLSSGGRIWPWTA